MGRRVSPSSWTRLLCSSRPNICSAPPFCSSETVNSWFPRSLLLYLLCLLYLLYLLYLRISFISLIPPLLHEWPPGVLLLFSL